MLTIIIGLSFALCTFSQIHTFLDKHLDIHIAISESPDFSTESGIFPTFLGVGGPKSGSTRLIELLSRHPQINVGNSNLGNQTCCGSELYVLTTGTIGEEGVTSYNKFYDTKPGDENIKALGEKTPTYSNNILAPSRVRAFLGGNTKILYTFRDSVEMDVSHFMHMKRHHPDSVKMTYLEWVERRVNAQRSFISCREDALAKMIVPNSKNEVNWLQLKDLYTSDRMSIDVMETVEGALAQACGSYADPNKRNNLTDPWFVAIPDLGGILHTENMKRWRRIDPDNFMCVTDRDQYCDQAKVVETVVKFMGLDPWPSELLESKDFYVPTDKDIYEKKVINSPANRLSDSSEEILQNKSDEASALSILKDFLVEVEDMTYIKELCPNLDSFC